MSARKVLLPSLTDTETMILYLTTQRLPVSAIAERVHLTEEETATQLSKALGKLKPKLLRYLFGHIADKNHIFDNLKHPANGQRPGTERSNGRTSGADG